MVPGPFEWILPDDLFQLAESFGQTRSFPSLFHSSMAAQKRVSQFENRHQGGLDISSKATELRAAGAHTKYEERQWQWQWRDWIRNGPVSTLERNSSNLDRMGLTSHTLLAKAGRPDNKKDYTPKVQIKVRRHFQGVVRKAVSTAVRPDPGRTMRRKLNTWAAGRGRCWYHAALSTCTD